MKQIKYRSLDELRCKQRREQQTVSAMTAAFIVLAESGQIDDVTATENADTFAEWVVGVDYTIGNIRRYSGKLYRCVQPHTAQYNSTPVAAVNLWSVIGDPTLEYPPWSKPLGSNDTYNSGDKVEYNGKKWVSTVNGNVWTPGTYGWLENYSLRR